MSNDPVLALRPTHWRLIAAIHQSGQLQMAAEDCGMTQPAASRMLAQIEHICAAPLYERTPKGMRATPIGAMLGKRAGAMVQDMRDVAHELSQMREGRGGSVRVGAVTGPALGYLVPAVRALKASSSTVDVTVDVAPSAVLARGLVNGTLDFALTRLPLEFDRADFILQPARDEHVGLLVRRDHPLTVATRVTLADLAGFEWVIQERGTPIRLAVEEAHASRGLVTPRNVVNSSSLLLTIALLAQTDAIAPMSEEVVALLISEPVAAGFVRLPLDAEIQVSPYYIVTAKARTLSPTAHRLRNLVAREMAESQVVHLPPPLRPRPS